MKNFQRILKVTPVRKSEHLSFNLLNFRFFKNSERGYALFFGNPRLLSYLAVIPYILTMELIFFRRKRYLVKQENQVVAIFVLREKPETLHISSLAVAPNYRKLGVATYILNHASEIAKRLNKKWLELGVSKVNTPALRLYKKFGFTKKEEKKWSFILRKSVDHP